MSSFKVMLISCGLACALAPAAFGGQSAAAAKEPDKRASAYYNFAMGHMYAELAATYGYRSDYVDKAIQHYRAAIQADPGAGYISEELTDLYMQAGKLRDAVTEAEDILRRDPENLDARRMLGRIYARLVGDQQANRIDDKMLKKAIEQYEKVTAKDPKDADSWLMLGRLYQVAQDSVSAEKAYKQALALDPDNEFALSRMALLYSDLGDSNAALEIWRKLADKDPRPQHLRALAEAYEQTHDYKAAAQTLRRALEAAPRDPELKDKLAEDLLLTNDTDEALKIYNELAAADPKNARLQLRISQVHRARHDLVAARAALERARAIDPESLDIRYDEVGLLQDEGKTPEAVAKLRGVLDATAKETYAPNEQATRARLLEQLGILYRSSEQFPEAVDAFRKMAAVNPDSGASSSGQIIETWRQAKDFTKAKQEADAAYKKYPNNRMVVMVRASLLADLGQTDEAAAAVKPLLDGKNDRQTYLALAQVYEKGKRFKEEADALDAAEKLSASPDDKKEVTFFRGAMYEKMKNVDAAEAEFRKVLALDPQNGPALNYLGYMLADRNVRLEEARKLIVKALEVEPGNGAYLDSLGWVNFRMGRLDDAETYLRQALDKTGNDPTVHDHLGDVYAQKGRLKDAIQQWELSLHDWQGTSRAELDPVEVSKIQKKLESARVRLAKESGAAANR
jgi:tetratricopeptide (TPR) repeat protein